MTNNEILKKLSDFGLVIVSLTKGIDYEDLKDVVSLTN